mmetsp:Transcript_6342/g.9209  ORF Transcript_6342/g.9209 Transcript_6342/m.9209 type:complete len:295 (+) Transcript_6342:90-974(+)
MTSHENLTKEDLQSLFEEINKSNPDELASAIAKLLDVEKSQCKRDDDNTTKSSYKIFNNSGIDPPASHIHSLETEENSVDDDSDMSFSQGPTTATISPHEEQLQSTTSSQATSRDEQKGCYLLYNPSNSKLVLRYSKSVVTDAIGFIRAGEDNEIRSFKFTRNFGRADLIGNCAAGVSGRKNYYSGWCQFAKMARDLDGFMSIYPLTKGKQGLGVDIYVFFKNPEDHGDDIVKKCGARRQMFRLDENTECYLGNIDAVACLPKHSAIYDDLRLTNASSWCTEANAVGASIRFSS